MTKQEFTEFRAQKLEQMKAAVGDADQFATLQREFEAGEAEFTAKEAESKRGEFVRDLEAKQREPAGRVTNPARPEKRKTATKEYAEAFGKWLVSGGREAQAGLNINVDSSGGYVMAPANIEEEIIKPAKNVVGFSNDIDYQTIDGILGSDGVNLTGVAGNSQKGVTVDLATESTTGEAFAFSARRMKSNPFTHWLKVPNAFLDFNMMRDPMGWITNEVMERKEVQDDYRNLYGTGVDEPLGALVDHADGIVHADRAKVVTAAGVITYAGLLLAYYHLKPQHRANAKWYLDTVGTKQIHGLVDSTGQPLPGLDWRNGSVTTLFGKPFVETNNIQPTLSGAVFAASQKIGLFCDPKRYRKIESKRVAVKLDPYRLSDEDVTIMYLRTWMDAMPTQGEAFVPLLSNA